MIIGIHSENYNLISGAYMRYNRVWLLKWIASLQNPDLPAAVRQVYYFDNKINDYHICLYIPNIIKKFGSYQLQFILNLIGHSK